MVDKKKNRTLPASDRLNLSRYFVDSFFHCCLLLQLEFGSSILLFEKLCFFSSNSQKRFAEEQFNTSWKSCVSTSLLAEGTWHCEEAVRCSDVTKHTYEQIQRLTGNVTINDISGTCTFCLISVAGIVQEALLEQGRSKWIGTFTLRFCWAGLGAGSGGGGRALLAAAARRTSSSCRWICCWIRTSSPSRPCWGTS